ncbi:histidinol-phosphate transaminase [Synechocystis sp. PCC 7509]|uniref:histidinol-phosphate transaminase n=1 Tax=Synechocystis sp. PCC 7509 TaxID=927677 RepID=UPI0002AC85A4|nr:histidinol-phosphate transaminase [Synechocystis sp. PCC 7509]
MLPFIRSDLDKLRAYKPHPGSNTSQSIDRLDTNESPYNLPSELKQKLAWTYQEVIESNRYPDAGHDELKAKIAEYVNQSAHTNITGANISVGNGSDEIIRSVLIATCVGNEGSILVANPTFGVYAIFAQTLGIPVVSVERSPINFEMDLAAAQNAITQTQHPAIRVVFVVHPNSPTGNALTTDELVWLQSLPEHILVVIDEAYFEFSQNTVVSQLAARPNWLVLRTFSKAFRLAAHRVGYAIGHPEIIAALEKIRLPYNLPTFSIAAALVALQHQQLLLNVIPHLIAERVKLTHNLAQHPSLQVWESAANFIYLRLKTDFPQSVDLLHLIHEQLQASGTLVRHISGGLRITVGSPEENQRTLNHLQAALSPLIPIS